MANRFWVGGTGTWDSTTTTNWAASSGGAGGASAPIAGDNVTFDASSGGGTVTPDGSIAGIAFGTLTAGAFTGTLAFNTNNPNMSFSTVSFSGTGTRTINMGSGTWTMTGTGNVFDVGTTTNLTPTFQNASFVLSATTASSRVFNPGASGSVGSLTITDNTSKGVVQLFVAATYASITVGNGTALVCPQSSTTAITGTLTMTGTSSHPVTLSSSNVPSNPATVSVGAASTIDWGGVYRITKSGAGSITATNSLDLGVNTSVTITPPSAGGGLLRHPGMSGGMSA
jgi:hypothetical protein